MKFIKSSSALLLLSAASVHAGSPPVFTELPAGFWPTDVSADGTKVVGYLLATESTGLWLASNPGVVQDLGGTLTAGNACISEDGTIIMGEAPGIDGIKRASKWMDGTTWQNLPQIPNGGECDNEHSSAWGMNGTGDFVVGLAWLDFCDARAYIWDPVNGSVDLGSSVEGRSSRANVVSANGSVVAGWQDADAGRLGAIWVNGVQTLMSYNSHEVGEAMAVSPNGQFIAGTGDYEGNGGWLHNRGTGVTIALPNLDPKDPFSTALAAAVSNDGSIVIGSNGGSPFSRRSIIWTNGVQQDLYTYLVDQGTTGLEGYTSMGTPLGANEAMTSVVGFGLVFAGAPSAWLVTFPPTADCPADINQNGGVDVADLLTVIGSWGPCAKPNNCPADIAPAGGDDLVNVADLLAVIGAWGPCP